MTCSGAHAQIVTDTDGPFDPGLPQAGLMPPGMTPPPLLGEPMPLPPSRPLTPPRGARPFDDSDPEMRVLLEAFYDATPCRTEAHGPCPDAVELLRGGSDRLATYLIRQTEQARRERFPEDLTPLRLLGFTESRTAFLYLRDIVRWQTAELRKREAIPEEDRSPGGGCGNAWIGYMTALEALGRTREREVPAELVPLLQSIDSNSVRRRVVDALEQVQAKHGPLPEVERALEEERARRSGDAVVERRTGP
jgi:hypothetical protein